MKRKKSYKIILTVLLCITFLITLSSGLFLELDERNNWSSKQKMSERAPPDVPPYCAVFP